MEEEKGAAGIFWRKRERRDCVYLRIDPAMIDCYSWWEKEQTKQEADDELCSRALLIKEPVMDT